MLSNDSGLNLSRPVTTHYHPEPWQVLMHDLNSTISKLSNGELGTASDFLQQKLLQFVKTIPKDDVVKAASRLNAFASSFAPQSLVMLYLSPDKRIKQCATDCVRTFVNALKYVLPEPICPLSMPIVLELCKLFRRYAASDDHMYKFCKTSLVMMAKHAGSVVVRRGCDDTFPFCSKLAGRVSKGLISGMGDVTISWLKATDVDQLKAFLKPLKDLIRKRFTSPIQLPSTGKLQYVIEYLYVLFDDLLIKLLMCFDTMEDLMKVEKENSGWDKYLVLLEELHDVSKLYEGAEELIWTSLRDNKASLCCLIVRYAKRGVDYGWILGRKDVIDFESRRHLVMLLLPEVDDDHDDVHEMFIDRSQLLVESFESIAHADLECLRIGLYMEFENEEATGPGVLRGWFFLVCQEIFNPKNGLFVSCPNDCRRFFPNPASKLVPKYLEYYKFTGRVIALALMHEVQVGIAFDRSFLLQLAGNKVSLEDIKDADPFLYSSCHQILEMDPMEIDQDTLGLTFVWETQELCPEGNNIIVNSRNRNEYVDLLIRYRFMTSISEQTAHFAQGFTDIVGEERIQKMCFRSLEVEDFDGMLYGSESDIDVQDWKEHTDAHDYLENDPQIYWFWEIVEKMSAKQRKILLFFWTSVNHLPVKGFCGLPSRLDMYKTNESVHRLPSSQTCFYQLCIPAYPSMLVMQERLNIITQDYVGYSFGIN